jgi:hypothetical protein
VGTGGSTFPGPASEADYSLDVGWQFNKSDVSGAETTKDRLMSRSDRAMAEQVHTGDIVRKQAVIRGWIWRKLDKLAKTGRYFQQTTRRVDWDHLAKAIEILGGTIEIAWLSHETA